MSKIVTFIQGGGEGGYEADARLVASLRTALGEEYEVRYPQLLTDETLQDFGWLEQINEEISSIKDEIILIGHSLGASMLLKCLTEYELKKEIAGIFLVSAPFWKGKEDWVQGLKLQEDFPDKLSKEISIFLYHSKDDEEVPFSHLALYKEKLPQAFIREVTSGGHQFNNDLTIVARDIKSL